MWCLASHPTGCLLLCRSSKIDTFVPFPLESLDMGPFLHAHLPSPLSPRVTSTAPPTALLAKLSAGAPGAGSGSGSAGGGGVASFGTMGAGMGSAGAAGSVSAAAASSLSKLEQSDGESCCGWIPWPCCSFG